MNKHIETLEAIFKQAEDHRIAGRTDAAITEYIRLLSHAPRHFLAYYKVGMLLDSVGRHEAALVAMQRSADLKPDNSDIMGTLGVFYKNLAKRDRAEVAFRKAIELNPDNIYPKYNLAEMYLRMNRTQESLALFEEILAGEIDGDNIKIISRWLRAVAKLTLGDYSESTWDDYESRIHHPTTTFPELVGERWTGQPLDGKTIYLAYEQRFGDVIQFSRFVPKLVDLGAKVILQTPHELMRLFKNLGEGIRLIEYKDPLPEYDYCQLVTSIPAILRLKENDITVSKYLDTDISQERPALPMRPDTSLKVGLLWAGKPNPNRSIPLKYLMPLLRHRQVSFYSFQLGKPRKELIENAAGWLIHDLSPRIRDFYDSSLLMKEMDLIITIDTAAAHQAGALGLPVWLMLIHYSDWRWGQYGQDSTIWYPSTRIFRQTAYESWDEVAEQLEAAFAQWVSEHLTMMPDALPPGNR